MISYRIILILTSNDNAGSRATDQYNNAMQGTNSQASMSGRYGSDAHSRMASNNSRILANH